VEFNRAALNIEKSCILLTDDHPVVLDGLRVQLEADTRLQIVGELSDGRTLLKQLDRLRPQLLILDLSMPGVEGIELISAVKQYYPDTRILIYSVHDSWQKVRDCLERGADGYAVKSDQHAKILIAVQSVLDGHCYLSPSICRTLVDHYFRQARTVTDPMDSVETLTPRERDVIRLTALGLSSREMAKRLGLKPKTVDNCRYRVRQKLDLASPSALVSYTTWKVNE